MAEDFMKQNDDPELMDNVLGDGSPQQRRRFPRPFLWHALFDGTWLCNCWHSRGQKERRYTD